MTPGNGLNWDELDELADYVAGALTGASAYRVAELIRTNERWAAAHAALVAAEPLVRTALHAAAEAPPSLPGDVAARLDAMLPEQVLERRSTSLRRHPVAPSRGASAGPPRPRPGGRPAGRSRRPVLTKVLAAVLVLGAVGGFAALAREFLAYGLPGTNAAEDMLAERGEAPEPETTAPPMAGTPAAAADSLTGAQVFDTGTDYRADTLAQLAAQLAAQPAPFPARTLSEYAGFSADGELADLTKASQLRECVTAVGQVHSGAVVAVDFARFEGEPAVILVVQRSGTSTVVAVGPGCGVAGADILASVEVT